LTLGLKAAPVDGRETFDIHREVETMKKSIVVVAIAVFILAFFAVSSDRAAAQKKPIELSLVSFLPDIPPGGNYIRMFMTNVDKISKGELKIKFMGPEAIPPMDATPAVQRGTVDMASVLAPFASTLVPGADSIGRAEFSPMDLRKNPAFKYYQDGFAKHGILYLGASVSSAPQVQTVLYLRKQISTLADLKGLKIASMGGANKAFIESIGAVVVPIQFGDYFTAMERGTVDGYNIGLPGIQDLSLTPVTKALLDEPFSSCGGMMIMNMAKFKSLTPTQQDALNKAMIQTEIDVAKYMVELVDKVKKDISGAGVKIIKLSPADSKAFYLSYRNSMWNEDVRKWPDIGPKLKQWLVDPDFPRAK
jgi:TRAP-type transport system periplasmic protein